MSEIAATLRDARAAGQQAARDGQPQQDNPYQPDGQDADSAATRVLSRMWDAGFAAADPLPVDYTG